MRLSRTGVSRPGDDFSKRTIGVGLGVISALLIASVAVNAGGALASSPAAGGGAQERMFEQSLIEDLRWRNIGNANQKGRISAVDALDDNFAHVVVGTASGGVFKSVNAGNTWDPIFAEYGSASIVARRSIVPSRYSVYW